MDLNTFDKIIYNFKQTIVCDGMSKSSKKAICKKHLESNKTVLDRISHIDKTTEKTSYYPSMMRVAESAALSWFLDPQNNAGVPDYLNSFLADMEANFFNTTLPQEGNWWFFEIGAPRMLGTIFICMGDKIDSVLREKLLKAIYHHCPDCVQRQADVNKIETGCNKLWKVMNMIVSGALNHDIDRIKEAVSEVSKVFEYVICDDGFYTDGSFIQHHVLGYNGGYGRGLLNTLADNLQYLSGTEFENEIKNSLANIETIIKDNYLKYICYGAVCDSLRGREISRVYPFECDAFEAGYSILISSAKIGLSLHNENILSMVCEKMIEAGITRDDNDIINKVIKECLKYKPTKDTKYSKICYNMDKAFHRRDNYLINVSMSSERIAKFEAINGENQTGWFQGDGAVYLYGKFPLKYSGLYVRSISPYHYPGTTVCDIERVAENMPDNMSANKFAGGVTYNDLYCVCGIEVLPDLGKLHAYKSYFMFDDEIICLGSEIESEYSIHTTCDNVLSNKIVVQGDKTCVVKDECTYQLLDNHSFDYFVNGTDDAYTAINIDNSKIDTYAYAMIPCNKTVSLSDIEVVEISGKSHIVYNQHLNLLCANVWSECSYKGFEFNAPCSFIVKDKGEEFDIAIADPTHTCNVYSFMYFGKEYSVKFDEKGSSKTITINK